MDLNEAEKKTLHDIWQDPLKRDAIQKAIVYASQGDPEMPVGALHVILNGVDALADEEEDEDQE